MYVFPLVLGVYAGPEGKIRLNPEDHWDADDPFVRAHPDLFTEASTTTKRTTAPRPAVEQATAAPGERRGGRGRS